MKPIIFNLTKNQMKTVSPLIMQAQNAVLAGKENRGAVFGQFTHRQVKVQFIDAETVDKILPILREAGL